MRLGRFRRDMPIGLIYVDLMASTFAVLFLILMVSLLRGTEEKDDATIAKPEPHSASDFRIDNYVLSRRIESDTHLPDDSTFGEVEIYDDGVRFYREDRPSLVMHETYADLKAPDSLFGDFLDSLAQRPGGEHVHLTVFGNGAYYVVLDAVRKAGLVSFVADFDLADGNSTGSTEHSSPPRPTKDSNLIRPEKADRMTKARQQREQGAPPQRPPPPQPTQQPPPRPDPQEDIWEWLTRKVYRSQGYDVRWQTHQDELLFVAEDFTQAIEDRRDPQARPWDRVALILLALISAWLLFRHPAPAAGAPRL